MGVLSHCTRSRKARPRSPGDHGLALGAPLDLVGAEKLQAGERGGVDALSVQTRDGAGLGQALLPYPVVAAALGGVKEGTRAVLEIVQPAPLKDVPVAQEECALAAALVALPLPLIHVPPVAVHRVTRAVLLGLRNVERGRR